MIKRNESDVGNIDFEIQGNKGGEFFCFSLFWQFKDLPYLWNQMSDFDGFGSKCSIFNAQVECGEKSKLKIADMWLIPLDHVTNK